MTNVSRILDMEAKSKNKIQIKNCRKSEMEKETNIKIVEKSHCFLRQDSQQKIIHTNMNMT